MSIGSSECPMRVIRCSSMISSRILFCSEYLSRRPIKKETYSILHHALTIVPLSSPGLLSILIIYYLIYIVVVVYHVDHIVVICHPSVDCDVTVWETS